MVGEGETVLRHGGHQSPGQAEGGPWPLDEKKSGWSIIDESIVYYCTNDFSTDVLRFNLVLNS